MLGSGNKIDSRMSCFLTLTVESEPFHDISTFCDVTICDTMSLKNCNKSSSKTPKEKPLKTIEYYTSQAAPIPEWCPEADATKEYENYPEEKMWTPAIDEGDDEWCPLFLSLARSALTVAQQSDGIPNMEAMENSCSGYADEHISKVFHDSGYIPTMAFWRLLTKPVPPQFLERWNSDEMMNLVEFYYTWKVTHMNKDDCRARFKDLLRKKRGELFCLKKDVTGEAMITRSRRRTKDQTDKSPESIQTSEAESTKRKRQARKSYD